MNGKNDKDKFISYKRFIFLSFISAFVFFTLGLKLVIDSKPVLAAEPSLTFSSATKSAAVGENFNVDVILSTVGQGVVGAGAQITFDPAVVSVVSIEPGTIFGDYPLASFDNSSGKISISGIASSSRKLFTGLGVFASITFQGKALGTGSVQFVYEPGSTTDSNIAVTYGSGDILGEVGTLEIAVEGFSTDSQVKKPSSTGQETQSEPTPEPESFFGWLLERLGFGKASEEVESPGGARPTSQPLDPHAPIPSQAPITDSGQQQPETEVVRPSARRPWLWLVVGVVTVAVFGVGVGGFYYLRRVRKREETQLPPLES